MQMIWAQALPKTGKETNHEKAFIQLEKAGIAYRELKFILAAEYYEAYLKHENNKQPDILKNLADCYWQMRNYPQAQRVYTSLYHNKKSEASPIEQFRVGELYARVGNYPLAYEWLDALPEYAGKSTAYTETRINDMKQDSLSWHVGVLNLNTLYREFSPTLIDSTTLLFSSTRPVKIKKRAFSWDGEAFSNLWQVPVSKLKIIGATLPPNQVKAAAALKNKEITRKRLGGVYVGSDNKVKDEVASSRLEIIYTQALRPYLGQPVKGSGQLDYNSGAVSIDQDSIIYLSTNYEKPDKEGVTRIRIVEGNFSVQDGISKVVPLPFGDPAQYSVMHPTVNASGTLIIFSSNKPGGTGLFDLYYSKREEKSQPWSEPVLLDGKVNTPGNEVFPTITPDGYLYYSSDAKEGLGGLDIYRIKLEDALAGKGEPEHLSYPINSASDDFGWTQTQNGKFIYFTSDRETSEDNIYYAYRAENDIEPEVQPEQEKKVTPKPKKKPKETPKPKIIPKPKARAIAESEPDSVPDTEIQSEPSYTPQTRRRTGSVLANRSGVISEPESAPGSIIEPEPEYVSESQPIVRQSSTRMATKSEKRIQPKAQQPEPDIKASSINDSPVSSEKRKTEASPAKKEPASSKKEISPEVKPAVPEKTWKKQLEGFVCDRQTMAPVADATVFILNKQTNTVSITRTNAKGKYTYPVTSDCDLVIVAAKKGTNKDCLMIKAEKKPTIGTTKKAPYDLLLDRYSRNTTWKLPNVYYNFDKWEIRPDARPILDELVAILKEYPIQVELGVHTDSRGSYSYNDHLSIKRAEAAVDYIVKQGVDKNRIIAKGYGERRLTNRCADCVPCSEMEHQQNRRTEIRVLSGQEVQVPASFDPDIFKDKQEIDPNQLPANFFDNCK